MTDAHCHVSCGDPTVREFLIGRDFVGIHPWETLEKSADVLHSTLNTYRLSLESEPSLGIGEIGLDRLKERTISPLMREVFETQLVLALKLNRPVILHGAKCWGEVVKTIQTILRSSPSPLTFTSSFLFHGFSRSDGLIPDIVKLGGFISVGPAILNDHAVNYRELVRKIPLDRLLVETDRTETSADVSVRDVLAKTAELRGVPVDELEAMTDANATRFLLGRRDLV